MATVRGYMCGDFAVGQHLRRERGLRAGPTIAHALVLWASREGSEYGKAWPVRIVEVSADDVDVLSADQLVVRATALTVVRELAASEVFGARAAEITQHVEEVDALRWLKPSGHAGVDERISELLAEHYAALASYGPIPDRRRSMQRVRTWHHARDLHSRLARTEPARMAAVLATGTLPGGDVASAAQLLQHKIARSAYFGMWDAAWAEAGRSAATGLDAVGPFGPLAHSDPHYGVATAVRSIEALCTAHAAAREPARRAAWDLAYDVFTQAPGDIPQPDVAYEQAAVAALVAFARASPDRMIHSDACATCRALPERRRELVAEFALTTCETVWMAAVDAAMIAGWRASYLVNPLVEGRPDPWRPLLDIWRLGAWPFAMSDDTFFVFVPEPRA